MTGYSRQSSFSDDDVIEAADHNAEFDALATSFSNTDGHIHDGTADNGPVINVIGDAGIVTPLNKILVDTGNNNLGFWVDVSSTSVEQITISDGLIAPVVDNDVDLGTAALSFKDAHIQGDTIIGGDLTLAAGNITASGNFISTTGGFYMENHVDIRAKDTGGTYRQVVSLTIQT